MANVYALYSTLWSQASTWNAGALPTSADDVWANGKSVTVDVSASVLSLRTTVGTGISAGGGFSLTNGVILYAPNVYVGTTTAVSFSRPFPEAATFVGSASGGATPGFIFGMLNSSTGTLTLCGDFYGPSTATNQVAGIRVSSGTMNVYGRIIGVNGANQSSGALVQGGTLNVYGDIIDTDSQSLDAVGCNIIGGGTVNVVGNVLGKGRSAIQNTPSTSVINVSGNVVGGYLGGRAIYGQTSPARLRVVGTISGPGNSGLFGNASAAVYLGTGGCTVEVLGRVVGGTGQNSHGIESAGVNTISLTGAATGGAAGGVYGIYCSARNYVYVDGSAVGGVGSGSHGIYNASVGSVTITGTVSGGNGSGAYGAVNASTGYLTAKKAIGNGWGRGSSGIGGAAPGIFGSQTGTTIIEELECGPRGQWPTGGNVFLNPQNTTTATLYTSALSAAPSVVLFPSISSGVLPPVSSVRFGTSFGDFRGTCNVPSPSSVLQGVSVDNSVGVAALQPQTIWNYSVLSATDINSLGGRLKSAATVQSVGQQLTALS